MRRSDRKWLLLTVLLILLPTSGAWAGFSATSVSGPSASPPTPSEASNRLRSDPSGNGLSYLGCGGELAPEVNGAFEQDVVELVNVERADRSLPPLKRTRELDQAARYHATDMGQDDYADHDTHDLLAGQLVCVCSWNERVQTYYTGWEVMAENIGAGDNTPQRVVQSWMSSEGHRRNILNDEMWEIGAGFYSGSGMFRNYWTLNFGRRGSVYPLVIDGEAATTDSVEVTLYLYGEWDQIRLRNNAGSWSAWLPFHNTMSWTLDGSPGEQTVRAEMRSGGRAHIASDDIVYSGSGSTPTSTPRATALSTPGVMSQRLYVPLLWSRSRIP